MIRSVIYKPLMSDIYKHIVPYDYKQIVSTVDAAEIRSNTVSFIAFRLKSVSNSLISFFIWGQVRTYSVSGSMGRPPISRLALTRPDQENKGEADSSSLHD